MIVLPGRFFLFFVSRQKDEWWSEKFFPRGCLSLSRSSRQTKPLPRDRNTDDDVVSLLLLSLSFRSRRRDNEACVCPRRFPRACVQIPPMGKFNPQKLCALSLSCASLETERRTKNVAHEYSRSLDGLAMPACLSRSRIRECKEREKRSKICPEIASFFSSSFILQLSAHNFHRGAGESETTTHCEILLFEPNTHREKTTTTKKKKEENFMSAYYFRSV